MPPAPPPSDDGPQRQQPLAKLSSSVDSTPSGGERVGTGMSESSGSSGSAAPARVPHVEHNRRPQQVKNFLMGGEVHPDWFLANRRMYRFFLINLERVIGSLNLDHTKCQVYFEQAEEIIPQETTWPMQYPFEYTSSHTQIYPSKRREPKSFSHAATIIVAMEFAARDKNVTFNVYDYLRILPAQYFVDRFNKERFEALIKSHDAMTADERAARFGANLARTSFENLCLINIEQEHGANLLRQMVDGYCITKYTAEKLVEFINKYYPAELQVGPVRSAGEESISKSLGYKNAAEDLRVPKNRDPSLLPPCF